MADSLGRGTKRAATDPAPGTPNSKIRERELQKDIYIRDSFIRKINLEKGKLQRIISSYEKNETFYKKELEYYKHALHCAQKETHKAELKVSKIEKFLDEAKRKLAKFEKEESKGNIQEEDIPVFEAEHSGQVFEAEHSGQDSVPVPTYLQDTYLGCLLDQIENSPPQKPPGPFFDFTKGRATFLLGGITK